MIPKLLKAVGLKKRCGNRYVVNGIDMEIQQNEVIAVIGPNGAGKSTMLDLILGLKKADDRAMFAILLFCGGAAACTE